MMHLACNVILPCKYHSEQKFTTLNTICSTPCKIININMSLVQILVEVSNIHMRPMKTKWNYSESSLFCKGFKWRNKVPKLSLVNFLGEIVSAGHYLPQFCPPHPPKKSTYNLTWFALNSVPDPHTIAERLCRALPSRLATFKPPSSPKKFAETPKTTSGALYISG